MNNRAYSLLEIKAVETVNGKRTFRGIASTPEADRAGDIVEPKGAQFKLPLPLLWQHDAHQPIGWVTSAKVTDKGIEVEGEVASPVQDGPLKTRIEEAWQMLREKLVRGLSIGFRSIESALIDGTYSMRFMKWEWLELSAVTIAANQSASITSIKSIDTTVRAALGLTRKGVVRLDSPPGASGLTSTTNAPKGKDMKTIQEQIAEFTAKRQASVASLTDIVNKSLETGETLDAEQQTKHEELTAEIKAIDRHLVMLKDSEAMMLSSPKTQTVANVDPTQTQQTVHAQVKTEPKLEKGIEFARYAMCLLAAKGDTSKALRIAKTHYSNQNRLLKTLEFQSNGGDLARVMKAAVEAGTTLDATFAAPLVDYQNFAGDFVEFLRPRTIIGQFGQNGVPSLNRIPFNVRIAGQTSGGTAYWTGEGAPKPLTNFDFNAVELRWYKIATIAVLTQELIRFSDPSAERLVRDALAAAVIERADIDFIDPTKILVANVSPASITNGATAIASSGNDADDIRADLKALWAPFIAARNPPSTAVYIMNSTTALALSLMQNPLGQPEFPGITMRGGSFNGVPVIVSDYIANPTSGAIVVLVNANDIWLADDGQVTIDASDQTALQMDDAPTNNSATATHTTLVSMFQTNSVAFRAERFINWQRRRSSGVAYLTGVNWGE